MRLYKCLDQTLDLDHVLAVSDIQTKEFPNYFIVTLALRDVPLGFSCPYLEGPYEEWLKEKEKFMQARERLIEAWGRL